MEPATMKLTNLILSGALAAGIAANSFGSVFFSIDLGTLQDENGEPLVGAGMLYLVASTDDDTFSLPSDGSIIDGASDDEIVASWDLSAEASQGGEYILTSGAVPFGGEWEAGNDLAILWFPNLTVANQVPSAGEPYGFYRNTSESGAGDVWEMPENGTLLHSLKFFPDVSNPLVDVGDVPSLWLQQVSERENPLDRLHRQPTLLLTRIIREPLISTGRELLFPVVDTESKENWPVVPIGRSWEPSEARQLRSMMTAWVAVRITIIVWLPSMDLIRF